MTLTSLARVAFGWRLRSFRQSPILALALALSIENAAADTLPVAPNVSADIIAPLAPLPPDPKNPILRSSAGDTGIRLYDWMFYPKLSVGAAYNDNLLQTEYRRISATGTRIRPDLFAERDSGRSDTIIYANGDAWLYPSARSGDQVDGQVGLNQTWRFGRDLQVSGMLEYDRLTYLVNGGPYLTAGGPAYLVSPEHYQTFQAGASIKKSFDRLFLGLALDSKSMVFAPLDTTYGLLPEGYRNGLVTTLTGRAGYWATPAIYVFTEAAGNTHALTDAKLDSRGYRVLAGVGSDRIGLFRGEVYGGYQRQSYAGPFLNSASSPLFGGKVMWYPRREWKATVALDEIFTDYNMPTPSNPLGMPARDTASQFNVDYQLALKWSAVWRNRYDHFVYLDATRRDDNWQTGLTINYEISHGLGLWADASYDRFLTTQAYSNYTNTVMTLGGTSKF